VTESARQEALAFAANLAACLTDAIGSAVVSVILHGSLTLGDFVPGRSDIDLLTVVDDRLTADQLGAVRDAVDRPRDGARARLDLRVVTAATAALPTRTPPLEAAVVLHPGQMLAMETRIAQEPDLVIELSVARAHGRNIIGGGPDEVIAPVPREWLVEIGDRQLAAWECLTTDDRHAELMTLTPCRIWRFAAEGVHCSKTAAGRWALERDSSLPAVAEALRQRAVEPGLAIEAQRDCQPSRPRSARASRGSPRALPSYRRRPSAPSSGATAR
jgi:hypothetical protein